MSFNEIGQRLGITGAGARFICETALEKLRKELRRRENADPQSRKAA